jgi:two-component system cell cycle sensor histidine kinase/response regulator CckA
MRHQDKSKEQLIAELELAQKEYWDLTDNALVGIFRTNLQGDLLFANKALIEGLEYDSLEEISNVFKLYKDIRAREALLNKLKRTNEIMNYEIEVITKTGKIRNLLLSVSFDQDNLLGIAMDITERKKAEKALRKSEEQYRLIFDNSPLGIIHFDQNIIVVACNQRFVEIIGASSQSPIGFNMLQDLKDETMRKAVLAALSGEIGIYEGEYKPIRGNKVSFVKTVISQITSAEGTLLGGVSFFEDITIRKKAEKALVENRRHLDLIVNGIMDIIVLLEVEPGFYFRVINVNSSFEKRTGLAQEQVSGKRLEEIFIENQAKLINKMCKTALKAGKQIEFEEDMGSYILESKLIPLVDSGGKTSFILYSGHDITEKKKMEEDLLKVEKLESVGIFAGGIAHDFNNILTVILGNISLAKMYTEQEEKIYRTLSEIEKASIQAKELTKQLLTFAKGGAPILKTSYMREMIKDTVKFALRGSNVKCRFTVQDDLWTVDIDEGQISQVINNLVINAKQAMPDGGMVKVTAKNIAGNQEQSIKLKDIDYVKVSFGDNGTGISEEHLAKIFVPYFTTKTKGSGLGLATSFSIIKKHKGYITVDSELGAGTTFIFYLPASQNEKDKHHQTEEFHIAGKGRILVMDDEKKIRDTASNILTQFGYEVACAFDGTEAIKMYKEAKETGQPFNAVIMDLTIPGGMGGKETIKQLISLDPGIKVIVSSGYSNDPIMVEYTNYGFCSVVAKPYSSQDLGRAVHSALSNDTA